MTIQLFTNLRILEAYVEATEKTRTQAKAEIEAWAMHSIQQAGLEVLQGTSQKLLEEQGDVVEAKD